MPSFSYEEASAPAPSSFSYEEATGKPPKAVGALSYIAQQAKAGLTSDLPTIAGKALQYAGATDVGGRMRAYGEANAAEAQPDEGRGAVTKMVAGAVRGAAPIVPLAIGGLAANVFAPEVAVPLELAGAAGLAGGFGGAQAQDTFEKAKAAGRSDEEATSVARKTGAITGVGMGAVGALTGGLAAPAIRALAGTGAKTAAESLASTAAPQFARPFVADTAGHLVGNVASMAAANAGTAAVEQRAGLPGPTPGEAALEGVGSGAGLTAALLPFGAARTALARRANTAAVNRLQSADTDPQARADVAAQIHANLHTIDPEAAGHFADNVAQAIDAKQPLELGEHLLGPQELPQEPAAPLALPAPVVRVDAQGNAVMDGQPPTGQDEPAARVVGRASVGDITDVEPKSTRAESMGIDANAGPISRAAAIAVDTGAHDIAVAQAAAAQAEEAARKAPKGKPDETAQASAEPAAPAPDKAAAPLPAGADVAQRAAGLEPVETARRSGEPPSAVGAGDSVALTRAAHEAATSPLNDRREPSPAQQEAGNYKKGHVNFAGLDVSIENPVGSSRSGVGPDGKPWSVDMTGHYGYIRKTTGADGDHVDVYIAALPHPEAKVYVVDQHEPGGKFDEHKVILGAKDAREASDLYDAHFSDGSGPERRKAITALSVDEFKGWLRNGDTTEPLAKGVRNERTGIEQGPRVPAGSDSRVEPANDRAQPQAVPADAVGARGDQAAAGQAAPKPAPVKADASILKGAAAEVTNKVPVGAPFRTRLAAAPALRRAGPGHEIAALAEGGFTVRRVEKQAAEGAMAAEPKPLSIGMTPNSTEPVTVKDGVVHIGKEPAVNFESGEPVTVKAGASHEDIKQALREASALSRRQRFFGGDVQPQAAAAKLRGVARSAVETPTRYGKDGVEMAKGGEPFTTKKEADRHRKEALPQGRVIQVEGGFAVRDVTDAELKARQASGKKLIARARAQSWEANPMLAFLAEHGLYHEEGKPHSQKAEFSPDKNINVRGYGNIFRPSGMQPDKLAEHAGEEGFLPPGSRDADALSELIRRAIAGQRIVPQYAEGVIEAEHAKQLAQHEELADLTLDNLDSRGYDRADPELQARVRDLIALAEAGNVDHERILEDLARKHQNASTDEFNAAAVPALEEALKAAHTGEGGARAEDRSGPAGGQVQEPQGREGEGLTRPTREDIAAQQERAASVPALDEKAAVDREAEHQTLTPPTPPEKKADTGDMFAREKAQAELDKKNEGKPKDDNGTLPMWSRGEKTEPFYSALTHEVDKIPAKAQLGMGWQAQIKGLIASGKVKADEVAWSGLDDWLKLQQGKVTKEKVAEFLKNNGVKVETVEKGGTGKNKAQELDEINVDLTALGLDLDQDVLANDAMVTLTRRRDGAMFDFDEGKQQLVNVDDRKPLGDPRADALAARAQQHGSRAMEAERDGEEPAGTKYGRYTLPGGTNYREVLLTLPNVGVRMDQRKAIFDEYQPRIDALYKKLDAAVGAESARLTNELRALQDERNAKADEHGKPGDAKYTSGHWDEPNILAHIRVNDRVDADGKRVLFVEELQSDWAQAGRKQGFAHGDPEAAARKALEDAGLTATHNGVNWIVKDADGKTAPNKLAGVGESFAANLGQAAGMALGRRDLMPSTGRIGPVPRAPFVDKTDAWVSLALKRVIRMAADEGYDRVAFVNGEQSADRYDLSKQISRVRFEDNHAGGVGRAKLEGEPTFGRLVAYDHDGKQVIERTVHDPAKELPDLVGKDVAQKLLNAPGKSERTGGGNESRVKELSGLDLKVGGEGMKSFYDKIVPSVAKDVLKKLGGESLTEVRIPRTDARVKDISYADLRADMREVSKGEMSREEFYENWPDLRSVVSEGDLEDLDNRDPHNRARTGPMITQLVEKVRSDIAGGKAMKQLGFDITPAMREKVAGGVPLFKRSAEEGGGQRAMRDAEVRAAVAPAVERLDVPFKLHPTVEAARKATGYADIPPDAKGMHFKGEVHLITENIHSALDAQETIWHEIEHAGVARKLKSGSVDYEKAMRAISLQNANIRTAARDWMTKFGQDEYKANIAGGMTPEEALARTKLQAVEEALAQLSGRNAQIKGATKFIAAIQKIMRSAGLDKLADWIEKQTDATALAMIFAHRESVLKPSQKSAPQMTPSPAFSQREEGKMPGHEQFVKSVDDLLAGKKEEAPGALFHAGIGAIDILRGKPGTPERNFEDGYGLLHIQAKHPEVDMHDLDTMVARAKIIERRGNTIVLRDDEKHAVVRLDWNGQAKRWLLTAFNEKGEEPLGATDRRIGSDSSGSGTTPENRPSDSAIVPPKEGGQGPSYSRALDKASETAERIKAGIGATKGGALHGIVDGLMLATMPDKRSVEAGNVAQQLRWAQGLANSRKMVDRAALNKAVAETTKAVTVAEKLRDALTMGLTKADKLFVGNKDVGWAFMQAKDSADKSLFDKRPDLKAVADAMTTLEKQRVAIIHGLDTGALQNLRENWFRHMWKQEPDADTQHQIFSTLSKRPFGQAPGSFKARYYDDFMAGIKAGLKPISDNPMDIWALAMHELDKYIIAHGVLKAVEGTNGVHLIPAGETAPKGYTDINGRFGNIERNGEKLRYVARDDVAQVVNNYVSQSLYHNKYVGSAFSKYMGAANTLNQFQLGMFSAFHAGFTSMEAVISHGALGVKAASEGDWKAAAKYMASAPAAWINNPRLGDKILAEWLERGSHPEVAHIIAALEMAGARFEMDQRFRTDYTRNMMQAWGEGKKFKAGINSLGALTEQSARPILEWLVPRQKAGVFGEMWNRWMEQNPKASHEDMLASAQQIWNRVDSRLGQVVYDRLFVHNVAKNFAQMLIRAPGWTGGTILEVGGGIKDLAKYAKDLPIALARGEKPAAMSDRAAYTFSMLMITAVANAALTAMFTGDAPQDWRDLVAFRTGNVDEHGRPERFMLPTYMKDVFAYANAPGTTLVNKAHPMLSLIGDVGRNRDFYGTEIRSEDDNLLTQLAQIADFTAKAFVPFWVKGVQKEQQREGSPLAMAAPLVGVMPAPSDLNKTAAEKLMTKYSADRLPQGSRTQEEAQKADLHRQMYLALRKGEQDKAKQVFDQGREAGLFGPRDYLKVVRQARQDPLVNSFKNLTYQQAERVMRVANDDEKAELAPVFMKKRIAFQLQHHGAAAE